ncbi:MAG: cph2 2 [Acidimicrobiales bacterium]|nr:cph2 2 [Acidimicrobiales bacterium]
MLDAVGKARPPRTPRGKPPMAAEAFSAWRWRVGVASRYLALIGLMAGAALIPSVGPRRWIVFALLGLVAIPYNVFLQVAVRRNGRPVDWMASSDILVALLFPAVEPRTQVPCILLMLATVALGSVSLGTRQALIATAVGSGGLLVVEALARTPGGVVGIVSFTIAALLVTGTVGSISTQEQELRARLNSLIDGLDAVVWSRDPESFRFTYVSFRAEDLLGWPVTSWLEEGFWLAAMHPADRERVLDQTTQDIRSGRDHELNYRLLAADGRTIHIQELVTVVPDPSGRPPSTQGITIDVTERKRAERRVKLYADIVERIDLALIVCQLDDVDDDRSLRLIAANPAASAVTNWSLEGHIGELVVAALPFLEDTRILAQVADVARTRRPFREDEVTFRPGQPDQQVVMVQAFPLPDRSVGLSLHDVTDASLAVDALRRQALHDGLTGLPNRTLMDEHLRLSLNIARDEGDAIALLVMDLDQFKEVNDALGHHVGDRLLVALARRLSGILSEGEVLARLGGDEFAVLLTESVSERSAHDAAERMLTALASPFRIDDLRLQTNASIGISLYPHHAGDASTLIQRADVAMYMAKRSGGGQAMYQAELDRSSVRRITLIGDLHHAVEEGQLVLHYQPTIDLRTGRAVRLEALVRWNHPEHGLLGPEEFIEPAELSGAIRPLTRWVLRNALDAGAAWRRRGHPIGLAVNLSVRNLYDPDLPEYLRQTLLETGFPARDLVLELTESELMDDPLLAREVFTAFGNLGVGTSIDDFGTGYSSLTYLRDLPLQEIKVDRSFVGGMHRRGDELTIVRSMIDLGHNLGLEVVAEGVEVADELVLLRRLGCDLAQGFHLSRPLPGPEVEAWLSGSQAPVGEVSASSLRM